MPHAEIHECLETNWKPGLPVSNFTSSQMLTRGGEHAGEEPDQLDELGPALAGQRHGEGAGHRHQHEGGQDREPGGGLGH